MAIRKARAAGVPARQLATDYNLTVRQVQRIARGVVAARSQPPEEPPAEPAAEPATDQQQILALSDWTAELAKAIAEHTKVLGELEQLSRTTENDGWRLGSLKARADLLMQRLALVSHAVPVRNWDEAKEIIDRFFRVLKGVELPASVLADLEAIVEEFEPRPATTTRDEATTA
jgi:hypothetical protein